MDQQAQRGLMSTYRQPWRNRGLAAWVISLGLVAFYCVLFWTDWIDPIARATGLRNKWFVYGALYSVAMIGGAIWYLSHHGSSMYNRVRIAVNVGVQVLLAWTVPFVLDIVQGFDFYPSYFWPLKIDYLYPHTLQAMPVYFAVYTVVGALLVAPPRGGSRRSPSTRCWCWRSSPPRSCSVGTCSSSRARRSTRRARS
jgi:hypothetical protein